MAEPVSVADQALKKLADQLECSICLDSFTDPKLLHSSQHASSLGRSAVECVLRSGMPQEWGWR